MWPVPVGCSMHDTVVPVHSLSRLGVSVQTVPRLTAPVVQFQSPSGISGTVHSMILQIGDVIVPSASHLTRFPLQKWPESVSSIHSVPWVTVSPRQLLLQVPP